MFRSLEKHSVNNLRGHKTARHEAERAHETRPLEVRQPEDAVTGAKAVYTDVWTSMGQEHEEAKRKEAFAAYQVSDRLMMKAAKDAVFMHCLPAYRGAEVTDAVMDSRRSVVFDQAENRIHVQKAILLTLMS